MSIINTAIAYAINSSSSCLCDIEINVRRVFKGALNTLCISLNKEYTVILYKTAVDNMPHRQNTETVIFFY